MEKELQPKQQLNRLYAFVDKYFVYSVVFIIVLVGVVGYWFFLGPKFQTIQQEGFTNYVSQKDELTFKQEELLKLQKLALQYDGLNQSELQKLESLLPHKPNTADLFAQFEILAQSSQIDLESISIHEGVFSSSELGSLGTPVILSDVGVLDITISVSSLDSYTKLKTFLDNVEKNMRLIDLTSLQYMSENNHDSYSLNLKSYYLSS